MLNRCTDFATQTNGIQELFQTHNNTHGSSHICLFLPKYHPELNFIERCWGRMKDYLRAHCNFTFQGLKQQIPVALSEVNLPVTLIRKYSRKSWTYCEAYAAGLDVLKAESFVRSRRAHRGLSKQAEAAMEELINI